MQPNKIRLGVIGANVNSEVAWAPRAHLPAILASPDFDLVAVCTTKKASAQESARRYGARLAFDNHQDLVASPEVDAVAVVVKTPSHYGPTKDALTAGKHVYTEWPLGANLMEAQQLANLARAKGVQAMVGLQARATPAFLYLKELVDTGFVGEVLSCHVSLIRDGVLERTSDRTWMWDKTLGQTMLTTTTGSTIDALRFVVGNFISVTGVVSTQIQKWPERGTGKLVAVTSPDNVLVSGRLENGAVASVHLANIPWAGSGLRMEIYGLQGTLVVTSDTDAQFGELRIQGAKNGNELQELTVPQEYVYVKGGMPRGVPYNVGQMYHRFAQAIRSGGSVHPNFDTAVDLHRLLDAIQKSSDEGREVSVPGI